MNLDNKKLLQDIKTKFDKLPPIEEINSYICIDCDKDLGDLFIPNEIKITLPLSMSGSYAVICKDCALSEDSSEYNEYI